MFELVSSLPSVRTSPGLAAAVCVCLAAAAGGARKLAAAATAAAAANDVAKKYQGSIKEISTKIWVYQRNIKDNLFRIM